MTVELENNKLYETEQLSFGVSCVNRCGSAACAANMKPLHPAYWPLCQ